MADLYIGVNVKDAETLVFKKPGYGNAPLNTAGFLVRSIRGIKNVMVFTDFDSAKRALGGFHSNYYGMYSIKGFFENAGNNGVLFVKRLIKNNANPASIIYNDYGTNTNPVLTIRAGFRGNEDPGVWGNNLRVCVVLNEDLLATTVSGSTTTSIFVNSLDGFLVNDIVRIHDSLNNYNANSVISSIDEVNMKINLLFALGSAPNVNYNVYRVRFSIYVYYVDPNTGIPSLVEKFENLSLNPVHPYYVTNIVNNIEIGSSYILVEVNDTTGTYSKLPNPNASSAYIHSSLLTGGTNGSPIVVGDLPAFYSSFDKYPIRFVANVENFGQGSYEKGRSYAASIKDRVHVHNLPDLNDPNYIPVFADFDSIINWIKPYRKSERYYSIILKDWIKVLDPLGTPLNPHKKVPIVGHLVGYMIDQIVKKGVHRVPANMIESIKGIVSIYNEVIDKGKLTDLVENGINVVSEVNGDFYLRSSRTISLSKVERYLNTIMTLIYVKESLKGILIPYENYPTDKLIDLAKGLLTNWGKKFYESSSNGGNEGGFGKGDFNDVFKVIVDESVNPKPQLAEGIVKALVYFVPPSSPAEKILLEVGLIDLT